MTSRKFSILLFVFFLYPLWAFATSDKGSSNTLKPQTIFSRLGSLENLSYTVNPGETLSRLAKKYGTTVELLRKNNEILGDRIYAGMKLKIPKVRFVIVVEKGKNRLLLLANGKPLKRYNVATGADNATPAGRFKIVNKLENPTWYRAGAIVPAYSPENILGTRWMGFDKPGYGIHGTTLPETIGTHASKGCIRMLNPEVEELFSMVPVGTRVLVKD